MEDGRASVAPPPGRRWWREGGEGAGASEVGREGGGGAPRPDQGPCGTAWDSSSRSWPLTFSSTTPCRGGPSSQELVRAAGSGRPWGRQGPEEGRRAAAEQWGSGARRSGPGKTNTPDSGLCFTREPLPAALDRSRGNFFSVKDWGADLTLEDVLSPVGKSKGGESWPSLNGSVESRRMNIRPSVNEEGRVGEMAKTTKMT